MDQCVILYEKTLFQQAARQLQPKRAPSILDWFSSSRA